MNENQIPNHEDINNNMNQNNINGVNSSMNNNSITPPITPTTDIPPITEVKVEVSDSITVDENPNQTRGIPLSSVPSGEKVTQSSTEPPKNSKASTVLLVLLFVFLFAFIMGMPYIRTFINELKNGDNLSEIEKAAIAEEERQKQEESKKQPTKTEEKLKELTCTSITNTVENYNLVETQKFYYNSKNKVLSSKIISAYTFTTIDDNYNNLKQQCDENSLKYATHEGFTMGCSYNEVNIEISYEFDLETFKPIVDGITNIQANATYQQDLNKIKTDLTSNGYTCQ